MKKFIYILSLGILFHGCDVIEGTPFENVENLNTGQKVLIEEFTGHQCGNCPEGTEEIKRLSEEYGDRLVIISIHTGFFAKTKKTGAYIIDYTTPVGDELGEKYAAQAYPSAIVNRSTATPIGKEQWGGSIQQQLAQLPKAVLGMESKLDTATRKLNLKVNIKYNKQSSPDENLIVYLTQDSIVSWQKDYRLNPSDIENYVHQHVLRASLNGTFGDQVSAAPIKVGSSVDKTFTYTIPAEFDFNHMHAVAILSDNVSKKVLQVEEVELF
jgi:thiol-disulfide isomerase/thioredoxin